MTMSVMASPHAGSWSRCPGPAAAGGCATSGRAKPAVDRYIGNRRAVTKLNFAAQQSAAARRRAGPQLLPGVAAGHHADMAASGPQPASPGAAAPASASAEAGGTMRSRVGITTRAGRAIRSGTHRLPADPPDPARRPVVAVPAEQAFARHLRRQRHPVVEPVLERDEAVGLGRVRIELGEGGELARHGERVEGREQALDQLDRQAAEQPAGAGRGGQQRPAARRVVAPAWKSQGVASSARPAISAGRRSAERRRQQPAHAIAEQRGGAPPARRATASAAVSRSIDVVVERRCGARPAPARPSRPAAAAVPRPPDSGAKLRSGTRSRM